MRLFFPYLPYRACVYQIYIKLDISFTDREGGSFATTNVSAHTSFGPIMLKVITYVQTLLNHRMLRHICSWPDYPLWLEKIPVLGSALNSVKTVLKLVFYVTKLISIIND